MSTTSFELIAVAVLFAAFVQASTGMGFALIVAPVLAFLAPGMLPVCLLILMLPLNLFVAWRERGSIDRTGAAWITAGRVAGTFGGLWVLSAFTLRALNIFIGASTVAAAAATLLIPPFQPGRPALATAGLITGVTETATGIGGPPLALVYQHRPPPVLRSTIALCFLLGELVSLAILAVAGRVSAAQFATAGLLLPALAVGTVLSRFAHRHLNSRLLRAFVLLFAVASGVVLVARA